MKITIINGSMPSTTTDISDYCNNLVDTSAAGYDFIHFELAGKNIVQCKGCWGCWWKTPGQCVIKDDAETILRTVINSDMVIFASPITAGFTSSLLKKLQDRLIVLIHPYIEPIKGECHHRKRYDSYPDFALLLQKEADTDEEDIEINTDIYKRLALNFHCKLRHVWFTNKHKTGEILHELSHF